jgi:hypothetical protein
VESTGQSASRFTQMVELCLLRLLGPLGLLVAMHHMLESPTISGLVQVNPPCNRRHAIIV